MRTEYCRLHAVGNIEKLRDEGCISQWTANNLILDQQFREEHQDVDLSPISVKALDHLRREPNAEIQEKVLKAVQNRVKRKGKEHGMEDFDTEKKMKTEIARFHEVDQETSAEKELREVDTTGHLRKDHLVDFLEDTEAYVNRMYDRGRTEQEIVGWVKRAIVNCRRVKTEHVQLRTDYDKWVEITYTPEEIAAEEALWKEQAKINEYLNKAGQ